MTKKEGSAAGDGAPQNLDSRTERRSNITGQVASQGPALARVIAPTIATTLVSVYADDIGRQVLGHILGRGELEFEGFDADDKSIGIFATQREAAAALGEVRP